MPSAQATANDPISMALPSAAVSRERRSPSISADTALRAAAGFWFVVTVIGQLLFAISVASFYGLTAARGDWPAWNKTMTHGHAPGYRVGNTVVAIHLLSAFIIILSGAIQLVPQIRRRARPSIVGMGASTWSLRSASAWLAFI
jgi:hypothetical protein